MPKGQDTIQTARWFGEINKLEQMIWFSNTLVLTLLLLHILPTDHVDVGEIEKSLPNYYTHLTHTLGFMSQSSQDFFLRLPHSILPCVNRKHHNTLKSLLTVDDRITEIGNPLETI